MPKFILILLLSLLLYKQSQTTSKYITEENDIDKLMKLLSHKELSLILIYSPYCPHCTRFKPTYEQLAEQFKEIHFYQINGVTSKSYKKKFNIQGYPTIFIYDNDKYTEYDGSRSFDTFSRYIKTNYYLGCLKIKSTDTFSVLTDFYKNKNQINLLIGFFNSSYINNMFDIFKNVTYKLRNYIDICAVVNIEKDDDMFNSSNVIISYNKYKGINKFNTFNFFYNSPIKIEISDNLKNILTNELLYFVNKYNKNYFIGIENEVNINNYKKLQNGIRENLIFVYENDELRDEYIKEIINLNEINENYFEILFDYTLYNKKLKIKELPNLSFKKKEGIYLVDRELKESKEITNLEIIKNLIKEKNNKENIKINNNNNNTSQNFKDIEKYLIKYNPTEDLQYEQYTNKNSNLNNYLNSLGINARKIIMFILVLIIYNIGFYFIYKKNISKNESIEEILPISLSKKDGK